MPVDFVLPKGLVGRFAVVKLWPEIKTAEDECIARLKSAAATLGIECIEVHADGEMLEAPQTIISRVDVDFVIHLHYDTPKLYDAFSFVALWNPLNFYHEWGYARTSRNLTTHDDFLSCSSRPADDHVARMIRNAGTHLAPHFALYHSTPDIVHPPTLGDHKLFYAGINWEAISGGKSRHQEVLKRLDKTGMLRIYGPGIFQGVKVWAGYDSYVREVPFDGVSMIHEIAKAGVALVLSSQAHKNSELMSNRLFESVAAGALVICDENQFAKRFFGDSLLYIDSRSPVEVIIDDITRHLNWAKSHPEQALKMAAKAQALFREKFTLIHNLRDLYNGFLERKSQLLASQNPPESRPLLIIVNFLMPAYSEEVLRTHLESIRVQDYGHVTAVLVVDKSAPAASRQAIDRALAASPIPVKLLEIDFFRRGIHPEIVTRLRMGEVIQQLLEAATPAEAFMVVAPNERLYSNHLAVLVGALQRNPGVHCAATAAVLRRGATPIHSVHEVIDFARLDPMDPPGHGRFLFRTATMAGDVDIALPYLDGRSLAVLAGDQRIAQQMPASITIDVEREFPERSWDDAVEREIVLDYCPGAFHRVTGFGPRLIAGVHVSPAVSKLQFVRKLFNVRWLKAQILAIRRQGLSARIEVLKRKLSQ